MKDITTNAIEKLVRKKISYDIFVKNLEMIDELAKIISCTRAQILDAIIFPGTKAQTDLMIRVWKEWGKNKDEDEEKKEKIKKILKEVEDFKKKWGFEQFPKAVKESIKKAKK